eukprot:TRINITY_DN37983_c0_g1_i1.p1 TRINITY_DN37983_c0_g1~~TRINITY_DN37983_c0_g1_i1.p1  ORF type:complete len:300 (+),score=40.47 TRINITY_DN37983_c0_g1_i1:151-1050(+)
MSSMLNKVARSHCLVLTPISLLHKTGHRLLTVSISKRSFVLNNNNSRPLFHSLKWGKNSLQNVKNLPCSRLLVKVAENDRGEGGGNGVPPGDGNGKTRSVGGPGDDEGEGAHDQKNGHDSFLQWYMFLLQKYPVRTKALTSALLNFLGDLFCQLFVEESSKIDMKRISMFTFLGMVLVGPTLHFWYLSLSKLVMGSGALKAGCRLLLDQFMFSPIFIGVFFCSLLTLEGRPSDILPKLRQDWFPSVVANWKLWIPFQFLNFLFVPQQLQVLAANIIALAWNVYLSFSSHRKLHSAKSLD